MKEHLNKKEKRKKEKYREYVNKYPGEQQELEKA